MRLLYAIVGVALSLSGWAVLAVGATNDPAPLVPPAAAEPPTVTVVPRSPTPKWTEVRGTGKITTLTFSRASRCQLAEESGAEVIDGPDGKSASILTDGKAGRVKVFVVPLDDPLNPARYVIVNGDGPGPVDPPADLAQRYKDAITADGGTAKADAVKLAKAYYDTADRLDVETDQTPTRLRTWSDVVGYTTGRAQANGAPPLPALQNIRKVTTDSIGKSPPDELITDANRPAVAAKYRTAGTALTNAAK